MRTLDTRQEECSREFMRVLLSLSLYSVKYEAIAIMFATGIENNEYINVRLFRDMHVVTGAQLTAFVFSISRVSARFTGGEHMLFLYEYNKTQCVDLFSGSILHDTDAI